MCISAKTVTLDYHSMWAVDVNTGELSFPSSKKQYKAEDAILSGRASELFLYRKCLLPLV